MTVLCPRRANSSPGSSVIVKCVKVRHIGKQFKTGIDGCVFRVRTRKLIRRAGQIGQDQRTQPQGTRSQQQHPDWFLGSATEKQTLVGIEQKDELPNSSLEVIERRFRDASVKAYSA